jgi:hypothetical protein
MLFAEEGGPAFIVGAFQAGREVLAARWASPKSLCGCTRVVLRMK